MLLATALALLITGCAQQTFTVQNKPAAVAPKETITHHFFVSGIGQKKKLSMQPKFVAAQKMLLKQETQQTFVKWIARFYYLGICYSSACIAHNNCMSCPSIWATLSALLINILLGSFQLFLHSDQPLSEGEISRSAVSASRESVSSTPMCGGLPNIDRSFWCATDDDQRQHHHAEHHFQL